MFTMEVSGKKVNEDKTKRNVEKDKLCEPCHDIHVTRSANGICQECKEHMCNTCFKHHLKARQCRKHVLIKVDHSSVSSDSDEEIEKCRKHGKEMIKYYCRKHDVVGCGDCMISGHCACKPEFIQDLSKDFKENDEFKKLVRKIDNMTSAIKESEKKIKDGKRDVNSMHKQAIKELREFKTDINEYFDCAENEINCLKSKNETILTKLEKDCKLILTNLSEVQRETNSETFNGKSLYIHTVECKPKVLDSENAIAHLQEENNIEKITFVPDKRFLGIIAPKLNLERAVSQVPGFVGTKKRSDTKAGQKENKDNIIGKKEETKAKIVSSEACARPLPNQKTDDIVIETFYHRCGKEFQCIYQSGMRYYVDDWGSKELKPFPKRWYNEGILVTNTRERDKTVDPSTDKGATGTSSLNVEEITDDDDDRQGFLMHPTKGRIPTYIFYKKHNVHMYFDRDTGSWVLMPIAWELHHNIVKSLVDQVDEAVPSWEDRRDMLALLRACMYDPDECISIYKRLEKDEWIQDAITSGKSGKGQSSGVGKGK